MKNIKKVILTMILGAMVIGVTACSGVKSPSSGGVVEGSLEEIMEKVYSGIEQELPEMMLQEVDAENAGYFLGVDYIKFDEALASEPMMSSQAHSIVLLRVSDGEDIEKVKSDIKDNVDGRKWICVEVEENNIITDNIGNLVILIMDDNSEAFQKSFQSLKQ